MSLRHCVQKARTLSSVCLFPLSLGMRLRPLIPKCLHGVIMNVANRVVTPEKRVSGNVETNCPSEGQ